MKYQGDADKMWPVEQEYRPVSEATHGFLKVGAGLLAAGLLAWPILGHVWGGPVLLGLVCLVCGLLQDD